MRFPTYPVKEGQLSTVPHLGEAWRVYLALIALAADYPVDGEVGRAGRVALTRAELAQLTGLATSYVSTALKRLVKEGMIGADSHRGRTTIYTIYPRWVPPVDSAALPIPRREVVLSGLDNSVDLSGEDNKLSSGADNFVSPTNAKESEDVLSEVDNSPSKMSSLRWTTAKESHSTRARSRREDVMMPSVREAPSAEVFNTLVVGGAGVESPNVADMVATTTLGAHAPDTTSELSWGWHGLLNREQWDEYAPEYERVHGEPLRVDNTKYFPGPDSYADALSRLRAESPRGDLRKVS